MDLFTHLTSKSHLYLSFRKAYRGRRKRGDVIRYHFALERHLHELQQRLKTFSYVHRPYHRFIIEDSKRRVINSPCFEDHILHHALYSLLYQVFDTIFIAHSYGNRVGKGSHKAVQALRRRLRSERFSWFMKCDISKYFQSVDHEILYGQIARRITDSRFLFYVALVINSYEEPKQWFHFLSDVPERRFSAMFSSKGMPIGNVTSQLFANIYLHDLDFYVEHTLKPAVRKCGRDIFYIRYVDDFIVLGETKEDLVWCYGEIQRFLEEALLLYLVPRKVVLNRCRSGIPFLGYVVWSDKVKVRQASLQRFVRNTKDKSHDARVLSLLSFYGHCQYTTTELFPLLVSQLIFQVSETNIYKSEVLEKLLCMEQKTGAEDRSRRQE